MVLAQREREAEEFDRFLVERSQAGESREAVLARYPALSRAWQAWKSTQVTVCR